MTHFQSLSDSGNLDNLSASTSPLSDSGNLDNLSADLIVCSGLRNRLYTNLHLQISSSVFHHLLQLPIIIKQSHDIEQSRLLITIKQTVSTEVPGQ